MWSDKLCGQTTYSLRQLGSQGVESFARGVGRLGRKGKGPAAASGEGAAAGRPRLVTPLAAHFSHGQSYGFAGPPPLGPRVLVPPLTDSQFP